MIIDVHAHIWDSNIESDKYREMIAGCRRYHIDRLLVSGLIGGYGPDHEDIIASNEGVLGLCRLYPDLVRGMVYVNPNHPDSVEIIRKYLSYPEFVGIKLWVAAFCDDPCVNPIVEEAIRQDVPILLHTWFKKVGQLDHESTAVHAANIAKRYPEAKFLMAHLGGNYYHGIKAIRDCPNVWVDNSGTPIECDAMDYTLKNVGSERILYGTDLPGGMLNCLAQVDECSASQEEKENIYYKNALRLFRRLK